MPCPDTRAPEMQRLSVTANITHASVADPAGFVRGRTPEGRWFQVLLWNVHGDATFQLRNNHVRGA